MPPNRAHRPGRRRSRTPTARCRPARAEDLDSLRTTFPGIADDPTCGLLSGPAPANSSGNQVVNVVRCAPAGSPGIEIRYEEWANPSDAFVSVLDYGPVTPLGQWSRDNREQGPRWKGTDPDTRYPVIVSGCDNRRFTFVIRGRDKVAVNKAFQNVPTVDVYSVPEN